MSKFQPLDQNRPQKWGGFMIILQKIAILLKTQIGFYTN